MVECVWFKGHYFKAGDMNSPHTDICYSPSNVDAGNRPPKIAYIFQFKAVVSNYFLVIFAKIVIMI